MVLQFKNSIDFKVILQINVSRFSYCRYEWFSDYLEIFDVNHHLVHHILWSSDHLKMYIWCIQDRIIIMASIIKANQLQDFGGNSILTSDGAGNLTTQKINYPAFEAYLSDQTVSMIHVYKSSI